MEILQIQKLFLLLGALLGFIAVAAGAFGAHWLKTRLSDEMLNAFEVGVRYQMVHAVVIMVVALALGIFQTPFFSVAAWLFVVGTLLFSGSLYGLSLFELTWLGPVTPLGGLILLAAWLLLILGAIGRG